MGRAHTLEAACWVTVSGGGGVGGRRGRCKQGGEGARKEQLQAPLGRGESSSKGMPVMRLAKSGQRGRDTS